MAKRKVFVIAGAAGAGKTTVANYLRDHYKMNKVVTHTTREPRENEQDGVDYHFESPVSMDRLHLLEEVEYDHHRYGSSLEALEEGWQAGKDDVIVLDTKGALTYHEKLSDQAVIIFLTVSDLRALANRMAKRGDDLPAIRSRLNSPEYHRDLKLPKELEGIAHVIVNDSWPKTIDRVDKIVKQFSLE